MNANPKQALQLLKGYSVNIRPWKLAVDTQLSSPPFDGYSDGFHLYEAVIVPASCALSCFDIIAEKQE